MVLFASYLLEIGWEWGQRLNPKVDRAGEIRGKVKESPRGTPLPPKFPLKAPHASISLYGF